MMDMLRAVIEQANEAGLLSRSTVEWFQLDNAEANTANLGLHRAIMAEVQTWADAKATADRK